MLPGVETIDWLLLDVDGVLTDGRIVFTDGDGEIKAFHVRDGSAIKLWQATGKQVAIISGRKSSILERRAGELGIRHLIQGASDKLTALKEMLRETGADPWRVAAMGDDLADLPILRNVGLAFAVADACEEARAVAHYVTRAVGGSGAVREVIDLILKAQGRWQGLVAPFMNAKLAE